eukprot:591265-Rhodomonas_salina.3
MDSERLMVLDIWLDKGKSMRGTIKHLQRCPDYAGTQLSIIDCKSLKRWVKGAGDLKQGDTMQKRGHKRVAEFETDILAECIIADHVLLPGGVPGTHDVAVIAKHTALVRHGAGHSKDCAGYREVVLLPARQQAQIWSDMDTIVSGAVWDAMQARDSRSQGQSA